MIIFEGNRSTSFPPLGRKEPIGFLRKFPTDYSKSIRMTHYIIVTNKPFKVSAII